MKRELFHVDDSSPFPQAANNLLEAQYAMKALDPEKKLSDLEKIEILKNKLSGTYGFEACGGELSDALKRVLLEEEYLAFEGAINPLTV